MIKIVSGRFRGLALNTPPGKATRPTAVRTREAIFSMLFDSVLNACVCDLFAGSGGMGIEAASRGAAGVDFVDNQPLAIEAIRRNLQKCGLEADVILGDSISFLQTTSKKYDIFFIDPPYDGDLAAIALEVIASRQLLKPNGQIVIEIASPAPPRIPNGLNLIKNKKYGKAKVFILSQSELQ